MLPVIGAARLWNDPAITSIGRMPMAPPSPAYASITDAHAADPYDSTPTAWMKSLNGRWRFRLFDHPDRVPVAAITEPAEGGRWTRIAVPGNWTVQQSADQNGEPDRPQYTNVQMPFDGPPPNLPERNPTGVYRRDVIVAKPWIGRRIVLHVGGAESVHALFVNGEFVGYGTDSRLASEYDITDHVLAGRNELAIVVVKWSAHSYVEDQDQWWMGGLHRDVRIEARAPTSITAVDCDATYNHISGSGTLTVHSTVGGATPPGPGWKIRTSVETLAKKRLAAPSTGWVPHSFSTPYLFSGHHVDVAFDLPAVEPWSAESPTRHRVFVELIDPEGKVTEVHTQLVGFRSIEITDRQFKVNGQPIWFFGVNRHDHHPVRGKAVTVDDMREDLLAMRRHNITAVRTAHYPNDPRLLDLADEIGLYVIDEANIESHAYNTSLCDDPSYRPAWVERVARMVSRDRNHPSIVMWSLGNESGHGDNHAAAAGWIRVTDPSRPLHYEGAVFHDGWVDGGRSSSDVVCPMYPTIADIVAYGDNPEGDRPLVMCEYSHAMGNSNGSLADYWDAITSTPGLQGGFIWEWKDHGLTATLPNGKLGLAYGGQFDEPIHDGNFVADGIMSAELVPHPAINEVEWVYRPVTLAAAGRTKLTISNRRSFTDLSDLDATWELMVAGEVQSEGRLEVKVGPHETVTVGLPCAIPTEPDAHLSVRWVQRIATEWAPAGRLVAWDQVELRAPKRLAVKHLAPSLSGALDLTTIAPIASIFRAPIDNDGYKLMPAYGEQHGIGGKALRHWQQAGIDRRSAEDFVDHAHRVDVADDGSVVHRHTIVVPDEFVDLGRVGAMFELPGGFDRLRWLGRGPDENYPDRSCGSMLGTWESAPDDQPYLVPQEFGLRTDCRWFEFVRSSSGETVRLDVLAPIALHISATNFSDGALYDAAHETDLKRGRSLVVHVDIAHRGVGTASCGPDVLPRYEIPTGRLTFAYRLSHVASIAAAELLR
ncbi:MAG: glycoside hydrolase family 2 TIM barrel-domain containing protein [Ilumatobacter sp.]|nr:glycoside hydrolase family 2 TIM barrel-domain containing protein [Ilumatobacter sp.]MDG2038917.1 glycoside hydrolase family 2 TIM barrel-domain containing protein [Ilumatobacter sp.]